MKSVNVSLRELFLLVALVAMGCGWWVDRNHLARANARLVGFYSNMHDLLLRLEDALIVQTDTNPKTGEIEIHIASWLDDAQAGHMEEQRAFQRAKSQRVAEDSP